MPCTMQPEAGARRGVYFNTECYSLLTTVESRPVWGDPKNKAKSTRKCMLESWLSLESENGEIEVATAAKSCVALC